MLHVQDSEKFWETAFLQSYLQVLGLKEVMQVSITRDTMDRNTGGPWLRSMEELKCTTFGTRGLTYLVGCSLVLGLRFIILAALCSRQLCYPNLSITGTHGQGGITTVRKELGLDVN